MKGVRILKVYLKQIASVDLNCVNESNFGSIPEEISRKINNAKSVSRKREILGGYLLLKEALKERGKALENEQIRYEKKGKPYVDGVHFNISHSTDFIALVCGKSECGIDIMNITPFKENVCKKYFTEEETEIIKKSENKDEIFTLTWGLKEAYFKMTGEGITTGTKDVDFSELLTLKIPLKKEMYGTYFYCDKMENNYLCVCIEKKENIEVNYE